MQAQVIGMAADHNQLAVAAKLCPGPGSQAEAVDQVSELEIEPTPPQLQQQPSKEPLAAMIASVLMQQQQQQLQQACREIGPRSASSTLVTTQAVQLGGPQASAAMPGIIQHLPVSASQQAYAVTQAAAGPFEQPLSAGIIAPMQHVAVAATPMGILKAPISGTAIITDTIAVTKQRRVSFASAPADAELTSVAMTRLATGRKVPHTHTSSQPAATLSEPIAGTTSEIEELAPDAAGLAGLSESMCQPPESTLPLSGTNELESVCAEPLSSSCIRQPIRPNLSSTWLGPSSLNLTGAECMQPPQLSPGRVHSKGSNLAAASAPAASCTSPGTVHLLSELDLGFYSAAGFSGPCSAATYCSQAWNHADAPTGYKQHPALTWQGRLCA